MKKKFIVSILITSLLVLGTFTMMVLNSQQNTLQADKVISKEVALSKLKERSEIVQNEIQEHELGVGDSADDVFYYLELLKVNSEIQEFQEFLDNLDSSHLSPINAEELERLLND